MNASGRALFLDRDGTLIEHKPYLHRPEDVVLLPGTKEGLKLARDAGWNLFLFTNQSGVGRGYFTLEDVQRVNDRMLDLIGLGRDLFTEICIAPESPTQSSAYRKPSPRFILETIKKYGLAHAACWMIGDTVSDWQSGITAGIHTAAIMPCSPSADNMLHGRPVFTFHTLPDFLNSRPGLQGNVDAAGDIHSQSNLRGILSSNGLIRHEPQKGYEH